MGRTFDELAAVVAGLDATVDLDRPGCLHLNDSKVPSGTNRDRHANIGEGTIGEGTIGERALGTLPEIRTESDSMGQITVPADRYWGAQAARPFHHFAIGHDVMPRPLIRGMGVLKEASARVSADEVIANRAIEMDGGVMGSKSPLHRHPAADLPLGRGDHGQGPGPGGGGGRPGRQGPRAPGGSRPRR